MCAHVRMYLFYAGPSGIFLMAVFLATTVGFYFERDAARFNHLLTALSEGQPVKVRRNGKVMGLPHHDVVVQNVTLTLTWKWATRCLPMEAIVCNDLQINESAPYEGRTACCEKSPWKAVAMEPIFATSSSVLPW